MDQKRLLLAISISVAILLAFELLFQGPQREAQRRVQAERAEVQAAAQAAGAAPTPSASITPGVPGASLGSQGPGGGLPGVRTTTPDLRVRVDGPRVTGSINLTGARFDDVVLRDYGQTIEHDSDRIRVLTPRDSGFGYFGQFGWSGEAGVRVPDATTTWSTSASVLTAGRPVTLSWDNGAGLTFELVVAVDDDFVFSVTQRVINASTASVQVNPWSRVRREYTPTTQGFYILHEGMVGMLGGVQHDWSYSSAKDEAAKNPSRPVWTGDGSGGWAGFTDKYWLASIIPDPGAAGTMSYRVSQEGAEPRFQVDWLGPVKEIRPGQSSESRGYLFAGAKEVHLLDRYERLLHVDGLSNAVDWGWFWFMTKPFFYALDWIGRTTGNFGVAILVFTLFLKGLFFPLANKSYHAMGKMKLLAPKMAELKEKYGSDAQKMQSEMMALYKREKVNPASGCLPIVIQIPVFFSLYKVLFVTIEMRHAPFVGWIRDLSAPDPTNIINLFGLLPFEPTLLPGIGGFLHLGVLPLFMGVTMFLQQRLNPAPPDPVQAKIFAFMPIIFTFTMGGFPAGLVLYWSWNNLLSIAQQWVIMKRAGVANPVATT